VVVVVASIIGLFGGFRESEKYVWPFKAFFYCTRAAAVAEFKRTRVHSLQSKRREHPRMACGSASIVGTARLSFLAFLRTSSMHLYTA
jgi:hypothetical protein